MEQNLSLFYGLSFLTAVLAFLYAAYLYLWVKKQPVKNATIAEVSRLIKEGANTFMRREYSILAQIRRRCRSHYLSSPSFSYLGRTFPDEFIHGYCLSFRYPLFLPLPERSVLW